MQLFYHPLPPKVQLPTRAMDTQCDQHSDYNLISNYGVIRIQFSGIMETCCIPI